MTRAEVKQFVHRELKGLWPRWESTEAEVRVWMGVLSRYAYDVARAALQQAFCEQTSNYQRPMPARFLAKARLLATRAAGCGGEQASDPDTNVFIQCVEPPVRNANLRGVERAVYVWPRPKQSDPDHVGACAETLRRQFEHLYGGHWITVVKKPMPARGGVRVSPGAGNSGPSAGKAAPSPCSQYGTDGP